MLIAKQKVVQLTKDCNRLSCEIDVLEKGKKNLQSMLHRVDSDLSFLPDAIQNIRQQEVILLKNIVKKIDFVIKQKMKEHADKKKSISVLLEEQLRLDKVYGMFKKAYEKNIQQNLRRKLRLKHLKMMQQWQSWHKNMKCIQI